MMSYYMENVFNVEECVKYEERDHGVSLFVKLTTVGPYIGLFNRMLDSVDVMLLPVFLSTFEANHKSAVQHAADIAAFAEDLVESTNRMTFGGDHNIAVKINIDSGTCQGKNGKFLQITNVSPLPL